MNKSAWTVYQQFQKRAWAEHPWSAAMSLFGQLFTVFALLDCVTFTHLHQGQSFQQHIAGLLGRAGFFTALAVFRLRWRQSQPASTSTDASST